jgi:integrase
VKRFILFHHKRHPDTMAEPEHHAHPSAVNRSIVAAVRAAGVVKHATAHSLRHAFATHLLLGVRSPADRLPGMGRTGRGRGAHRVVSGVRMRRARSGVPDSPQGCGPTDPRGAWSGSKSLAR